MSYLSDVASTACEVLGAAVVFKHAVYAIVDGIRRMQDVDSCDHGVFDTQECQEIDLLDNDGFIYHPHEPMSNEDLCEIQERCRVNAISVPYDLEREDLNTLPKEE